MTDSSYWPRLRRDLLPLVWLSKITRSHDKRRPQRWRNFAFSILLAGLTLYENLPAEAEFNADTRRFHPENTSRDIPDEPAVVPGSEAASPATLAQPVLDINLAQPPLVLEPPGLEPAIAPSGQGEMPAADLLVPDPERVPNMDSSSIEPVRPANPDVPLPAVGLDQPDLERRDRLTQLLTEPSPAAPDAELGTLRVQTLRSRRDEELGILRVLEQAQAAAAPRRAPVVFIGGRVGFFDSDNVFRSPVSVSEQVAQLGLALYAFPKLTDQTSLYAIAESSLVRYSEFSNVDYNELQLQVGLRQRLTQRAYAQLGWRNRHLYQTGLSNELLRANYIDLLLSRRDILSQQLWLDSYYQAFISFVEPTNSSRFHQTLTLSLNYGLSRDFRATLLYQLSLDDYTEIERFDTYHQVLGLLNYNITPNSRITLFGGVKFGDSTSANVDFNDLVYGIGVNVNVPLF